MEAAKAAFRTLGQADRAAFAAFVAAESNLGAGVREEGAGAAGLGWKSVAETRGLLDAPIFMAEESTRRLMLRRPPYGYEGETLRKVRRFMANATRPGTRRFASCAVVGSSGELRRRPLGAEIDAHPAVIRANAAPVGGSACREWRPHWLRRSSAISARHAGLMGPWLSRPLAQLRARARRAAEPRMAGRGAWPDARLRRGRAGRPRSVRGRYRGRPCRGAPHSGGRFSKFTGTRTTWRVFSSAYWKGHYSHSEAPTQFLVVCDRPYIYSCHYHLFDKHHLYPRAHAVNPAFYDQVREQLQLPRKLIPTTGLLAVAAAIHACGRVTLYGFGNGSRLSPYYYYKDFHRTDYDYLHRPEAYHGFRAERQALQRWHAMGAITWVLGGAAAPISR